MLAIAFILIMLGASPDCIPADDELLILFEPDRPICIGPIEQMDKPRAKR